MRLTPTPKNQPPDHWIARTYDALGPRLYKHALLLLADPALAEDAVQQAFIRLLARGRTDDIASAEPFLRTVLRHEAFRLLEQKRPMNTLEHAAPRLLQPIDASVEHADECHQLNIALRQLPPEQREIIHLKIYEQLTFAQIAELLAIPLNTAASRYRYALVRLRELLPVPRT